MRDPRCVEAPWGWRQTGIRRTLGRGLFVLWSLVLFMVCADATNAQPVEPVKLEHFQFVKAITFSDPESVHPGPLLIAEIKGLDVAADGQMLVADWIGSQVFLFGPDGELLAVLDPSVCHPGFEVRPVHAKFIGDHSIFLSNAGPWGYRFTSEGGCLGSVDPDYSIVSNPNALDTDAQGLVGFYRHLDKQVVRRMNASGKLLQEYTLPASDYPRATRRIGMGGLIADKTHHFYAGPVEKHILKLTPDGAVVDRISHRTSWFRDVARDLPDGSNLTAIMQASGRLMASSTLVSGLFELTDQIVMIQYRNGDRGRGYQIFTKAGQLVAQELDIRVHFKFGASGQVYRVVRPDLAAGGDLSNPIIEVYQFIAPE
ncbi:MAG: hypothetical protein OXI44_11395 [Bacteroidota bacterium]|nr:hypothetical protein [Bacteroidota bacterium]